MKILAQSRSIVGMSYALEYVMANNEEEYFTFPANSAGEIDFDSMPPAALDNLMACQDDTYEVDGPYLVTYEHRHVANAVGQCGCGNQVVLDSVVNTCSSCGCDYSLDGVEMPRLRLVG